jgi:hypothetical protein
MVATGVVPTAADELSIYVSRHYNFPSAFVERMTIRTDGFVSVNAGAYGGELLTRPFILEGGKMVLNFATSAGGGIRYEILDETGHPLPGHALEQTPVIYGDDVERIVQVQSPKRSERQSLAVRPVRISFLLRDADLYSVQFRD